MKPTKRQWIFQAWIGGGAQESCRPALEGGWISSQLRKRSMWSGWDDHKEASGVDLLPFSPWRTRSVCGFTGHCSLFWQQRGGRHCAGWMVCGPLSSPSLFPALPLPPCPAPCLTSRTIPHDRRCSCTAPWCRSYSSSLCSHRRKSVGIARSWHCRSTWSSCPCRDLLI